MTPSPWSHNLLLILHHNNITNYTQKTKNMYNFLNLPHFACIINPLDHIDNILLNDMFNHYLYIHKAYIFYIYTQFQIHMMDLNMQNRLHHPMFYYHYNHIHYHIHKYLDPHNHLNSYFYYYMQLHCYLHI